MSQSSSKTSKILVAAGLWVGIIAVVAFVFRGYIFPAQEKAEQQQIEQEKKDLLANTSSDSAYKSHVRFGIDGFSGYCVFRSKDFEKDLRGQGIKVELEDDGAQYVRRLEALKNGDLDMAVFTVDALVKASAEVGSLPASIVALVDETRGADAVLSYKAAYPNIDSLNTSETKFVITPDSPSETLARILIARFGLDKLSSDPFIRADGAKAVYDMYRKSKPTDKRVYVVWEPYATRMRENPNVHTIIDSSRFRGYIVDVVVVSRDFLAKEGNTVRDVVQSYLRSVHKNRSDFYQLVIDDAKEQGTPLNDEQARNLVQGVWWKNTTENYAHMGLRNEAGLQHIEDIIEQCTDVLIKTNAISSDPTSGQFNLLYYNRTLKQLQEVNFHPGLAPEKTRSDTVKLRSLVDSEWETLRPIGTLQVPQLVFARGSDVLLDRSKSILTELKKKLDTFPHYYLRIEGQASRQGDLQANQELALRRAKAAEQYLTSLGVNPTRLKALGGEPTGTTTVSFVLGEVPY